MGSNGGTNGQFEAHADSYDRFIKWMKFGVVATAIVTGLVIFLIAR